MYCEVTSEIKTYYMIYCLFFPEKSLKLYRLMNRFVTFFMNVGKFMLILLIIS